MLSFHLMLYDHVIDCILLHIYHDESWFETISLFARIDPDKLIRGWNKSIDVSVTSQTEFCSTGFVYPSEPSYVQRYVIISVRRKACTAKGPAISTIVSAGIIIRLEWIMRACRLPALDDQEKVLL